MAQKTRFFKSTKGYNAEVIVAKATAYTARATVALFQANAVEGEIGVYDADTKALITAGLTVGQRFTVLQKRDGGILKMTPATFGPGVVKKIAYVAPVKQVATVTFAGALGTDFKIDDEVGVKVIETTPGSEPFPTITYSTDVRAGDTPTKIVARIAARINNNSDLANVDGQRFVTATVSAGVLTLTAEYFGSSFRVALPNTAYGMGSVVYTTPFVEGQGYSEKVSRDEVEGNIFDGVTTQYPGGNFDSTDFASPTKFTVDGATYNTFQLRAVRNEFSPTPVNQHHHYWNGIIYTPTTGGPDAALTTALSAVPVV